MADDNCSNCDDLTCPFFGYADNCYRNSINDVKSNISMNDKMFFEEIINRCNHLYEKTANDNFQQLSFYAKRILDLINGE